MTAKIIPFERLAGTPEEMSDESLVAACALGDRAALAALFDRHFDVVRAFVVHLVPGEDAAADDLVQQVFLAVQRASGRFRSGSQVKTWILGIARNMVRHELRSRARRRRLSVALVDEHSSQPASIDEVVQQRERLGRLRAALEVLSPRLREAFVLVYVQGLSGAEAAQVLGTSEGAVWKQLHDARKKLRAAMGEDE